MKPKKRAMKSAAASGKSPGTRSKKTSPKKTGAVKTGPNFQLISAKKLKRLEDKLREAHETLEAIRTGAVDAVVVAGDTGNQIYSITGAEQPYRSYVERMQEGAVTVSAGGVILYCNQRFAEMVRLPLERVIGSDLDTFLPTHAWNRVAVVINSGDEVVKHADILRVSEAESMPVNITASRLPIEDQEIVCLVVTDLTMQRQHDELRFAKELAEKANHAKDSFLAALSHELRTPLNPALMTVVSLEQSAPLPAGMRESLGVIRRNIELEARMIDDLLDITRVTQGKMELHVSPVDLHTIIPLAVDICRSDIEAKRQSLELRLEAVHTRTSGDPVRLQQVIWNVVRNAAKFTPEEGRIVVTTSNRSNDRISIAVSDSGIGFPPDSAEEIFHAFEQGGHHITRRFGGLGLGLAISRSIIMSHEGTIRAHSEGDGKGATFTLELPLLVPEKSGSSSPAKTEVAANKPAPGLRILLVEDHDDTRKSMEIFLAIKKYQVQSASTGTAALALAGEEQFDLVITDLGLPDMSGYELMKELRERYNLPGIATTGYGMKEDIEQSRRAGFIDHLTKPIRLEHLQQLISQIGAPANVGK